MMMNLLRDRSKNIQLEAFHVFKVRTHSARMIDARRSSSRILRSQRRSRASYDGTRTDSSSSCRALPTIRRTSSSMCAPTWLCADSRRTRSSSYSSRSEPCKPPLTTSDDAPCSRTLFAAFSTVCLTLPCPPRSRDVIVHAPRYLAHYRTTTVGSHQRRRSSRRIASGLYRSEYSLRGVDKVELVFFARMRALARSRSDISRERAAISRSGAGLSVCGRAGRSSSSACLSAFASSLAFCRSRSLRLGASSLGSTAKDLGVGVAAKGSRLLLSLSRMTSSRRLR